LRVSSSGAGLILVLSIGDFTHRLRDKNMLPKSKASAGNERKHCALFKAKGLDKS